MYVCLCNFFIKVCKPGFHSPLLVILIIPNICASHWYQHITISCIYNKTKKHQVDGMNHYVVLSNIVLVPTEIFVVNFKSP